MSDCREKAMLQEFLDGKGDDAFRRSTVGHVENCEKCQALLSRLTEDPEIQKFVERNTGFQVLLAEAFDDETLVAQTVQLINELNKFEVIEHAQSGGMGAVFRCWDTSLERQVAIKVWKNPGVVARRTLNEAKQAAKSNGECVVTVLEIVELGGGRLAIVMEWIDLPTLKDLQQTNGLPTKLRNRVEIGLRLARSLGQIHASKVIHGDIKPSNIFVGDGVVKFTDFGLAQQVGDSRQPSLGMTFSFAAPEQIGGGTVDLRTDVYSLGVVLVQLLTGNNSACEGTVEQSCKDQGHLLSLPFDLRQILYKCLHVEKPERYPTANELASDLEAYLAHRAVSVGRKSAIDSAQKFAKRSPWLLTIAGLLCIFLLAAFFVQQRFDKAELVAKISNDLQSIQNTEFSFDQRRLLDNTLALAGDKLDCLDQVMTADLRSAAFSTFSKFNLKPLFEFPSNVISCSSDDKAYILEGDEHDVLQFPPATDKMDLRLAGGRFTTSGNRIYSVDLSPELLSVKTQNVHGGTVGSLGEFSIETESPAVSVSDSLVAIGEDRVVRVMDLFTKEVVFTTRFRFVLDSVAFNEDGSRLLVTTSESDGAVILETTDGDILHKTYHWEDSPHADRSDAVAWSSSKKCLAYASGDSVYLWWYHPFNRIVQIKQPGGGINNLSLSADGNHLLVGQDNGESTIWNTGSLESEASFLAEPWAFFSQDSLVVNGVIFENKTFACEFEFPVGFASGLGFQESVINDPTAVLALNANEVISSSVDGIQIWSFSNQKTSTFSSKYLSRQGAATLHVDGAGRLIGSFTGELKCFEFDRIGTEIVVKNQYAFPYERKAGGTAEMQAPVINQKMSLFALPFRGQPIAVLYHKIYSPDFRMEPISVPRFKIDTIDISPDGGLLSLGSFSESGIYIWDVKERKVVGFFATVNGRANFSPNGDLIVSENERGYVWFGKNLSGKWVEKFRTDNFNAETGAGAVAFGGTKFLAVGRNDMTVDLLLQKDGSKLATLPASPTQVTSIDFSLDGQMLAIGSRDHRLQYWNLNTVNKQLSMYGLGWEGDNFEPKVNGNISVPVLFEPLKRGVAPKIEMTLQSSDDCLAGDLLALEYKISAKFKLNRCVLQLYKGTAGDRQLMGQIYEKNPATKGVSTFRWAIPPSIQNGRHLHYLNGDDYWIKAVVWDKSKAINVGFCFSEEPITIWAK